MCKKMVSGGCEVRGIIIALLTYKSWLAVRKFVNWNEKLFVLKTVLLIDLELYYRSNTASRPFFLYSFIFVFVLRFFFLLQITRHV